MDKNEIKELYNISNFKMIGQGNTAAIYQYEQGRILKLFREGLPTTIIFREYENTKAIQSKLTSIPKAYEMVSYEGRYGIVYEQIIGRDLIKVMFAKLYRLHFYSKMLASIHAKMHSTEVDVAYSVKDKLSNDVTYAEELSDSEKAIITKYIATLPEGTSLCHFDYHPGNVMLQQDSPVVSDWMTACTGNPCADVARTLLMLKYGEMEHVSSFMNKIVHMFMKKIKKTYYAEYKKITGITDQEIEQWMLPVVAARLSEWLTNHERAQLLAFTREKIMDIQNNQ